MSCERYALSKSLEYGLIVITASTSALQAESPGSIPGRSTIFLKEIIMEKELFICSKCGHSFETEQYKIENYETEPYMVVICTCTNCGSKIFKKRED